ncbi:hypothetical protein PanWU01x14_344670 [Parasponia andersonii]|uniref:Uncharacterized protein n=1 Tax=Parasponia andersonii TaxID=3476 RepID=A0A2P5ACZ4_PARAD|nr:hypothetical protein PanWU01x14_344670 [Parasponia andersonii]
MLDFAKVGQIMAKMGTGFASFSLCLGGSNGCGTSAMASSLGGVLSG